VIDNPFGVNHRMIGRIPNLNLGSRVKAIFSACSQKRGGGPFGFALFFGIVQK